MGDLLRVRHTSDTQFFEGMQEMVWLIQVEYKHKEVYESGHGTGFAVRDDGWIMTCSHTVPNHVDIDKCRFVVRRKDDVKFFEEVKAKRILQYDILLLKIDGIKCKFGELAQDRPLLYGQRIFHIGHPENLHWSFMRGDVAYPCEAVENLPKDGDKLECSSYTSNGYFAPQPCRIMGHIWNRRSLKLEKTEGANELHPLIPLVQTNLLTDHGSSGGPVYDADGFIVAMVQNGFRGYTFATHASLLRRVLEENVQ